MDELWWIRAGQLATARRSEMAAETFITASGAAESRLLTRDLLWEGRPLVSSVVLTGACGDAPALGTLLARCGLMRSNDVRAAKATEAI